MPIKSVQDDELYMCRVSCKEIVGVVGDGCGMYMCGVHCGERGGDEYELCMCRVS